MWGFWDWKIQKLHYAEVTWSARLWSRSYGGTRGTSWRRAATRYCTVLYCTVLYCTVLYCTVLYCTVLYCTVLYCTVLTYERLHGAGVEGPVDPMFPVVVALLMVARAHVASVRAWGWGTFMAFTLPNKVLYNKTNIIPYGQKCAKLALSCQHVNLPWFYHICH